MRKGTTVINPVVIHLFHDWSNRAIDLMEIVCPPSTNTDINFYVASQTDKERVLN